MGEGCKVIKLCAVFSVVMLDPVDVQQAIQNLS